MTRTYLPDYPTKCLRGEGCETAAAKHCSVPPANLALRNSGTLNEYELGHSISFR